MCTDCNINLHGSLECMLRGVRPEHSVNGWRLQRRLQEGGCLLAQRGTDQGSRQMKGQADWLKGKGKGQGQKGQGLTAAAWF